MIVHQHVGLATQSEPFHRLRQKLQKTLPIPILAKHRPPLVAPCRDMIPAAGYFDPDRSRHARQIADRRDALRCVRSENAATTERGPPKSDTTSFLNECL